MSATTVEIMIDVIGAVNALLKNGQFETVDKMLTDVDLSKLSPEMMCVIARTSYIASENAHIKNWQPFVLRIRDELARRNIPIMEIMHGLIGIAEGVPNAQELAKAALGDQ